MFRFIRIHETYRIHGFSKINELQGLLLELTEQTLTGCTELLELTGHTDLLE